MEWSFDTKAIHAGEAHPRKDGAITLPIFQSSTFEYGGEGAYDDIKYIRLNNTPNHIALNRKLAELEQTESALVTASGMSAITTALLALIPVGGHVLAQDGLYGGTHHFFTDYFQKMGREVSFFSNDRVGDLSGLLRKNTKGIYVESVTNPHLRICDLQLVAQFAKEKGLHSFIDNTFPSPVNFNPSLIGFDVILHSATKYLNGHSDIVAGAVAGKADRVEQIRKLLNHLGGSLDPHACFLLHRGLKTLGVRVRQQGKTAHELATVLSRNPKIRNLSYPGLASHPEHTRAREWFRGFGAMISFEFDGSVKETDAFLKALTLPILAPSLGGVETLVTRPATTSHSGLSVQERARLGISDTLVRVSVGLEDAKDLISDFEKQLQKAH